MGVSGKISGLVAAEDEEPTSAIGDGGGAE